MILGCTVINKIAAENWHRKPQGVRGGTLTFLLGEVEFVLSGVRHEEVLFET